MSTLKKLWLAIKSSSSLLDQQVKSESSNTAWSTGKPYFILNSVIHDEYFNRLNKMKLKDEQGNEWESVTEVRVIFKDSENIEGTVFKKVVKREFPKLIPGDAIFIKGRNTLIVVTASTTGVVSRDAVTLVWDESSYDWLATQRNICIYRGPYPADKIWDGDWKWK